MPLGPRIVSGAAIASNELPKIGRRAFRSSRVLSWTKFIACNSGKRAYNRRETGSIDTQPLRRAHAPRFFGSSNVTPRKGDVGVMPRSSALESE